MGQLARTLIHLNPDGLVSFLAGPYEGKRHDSGMLRESGLLPLVEQYSVSPAGGNNVYLWRSSLSIKASTTGSF